MAADNWLMVATPTTVYCGIASREDFDRIALPVQDHGPGRPVLTKTATHEARLSVQVVFQHWYGPNPADQEAAEAIARMRGRATPAAEVPA